MSMPGAVADANAVIVQLKRHGLITDVRPVLDAMLQAKHGIQTALYEQVLRSVGEWPTP